MGVSAPGSSATSPLSAIGQNLRLCGGRQQKLRSRLHCVYGALNCDCSPGSHHDIIAKLSAQQGDLAAGMRSVKRHLKAFDASVQNGFGIIQRILQRHISHNRKDRILFKYLSRVHHVPPSNDKFLSGCSTCAPTCCDLGTLPYPHPSP